MFNEMNYVYAVYLKKSFSKAAKDLNVSQPALSNMVKKAEANIGHAIFDRSTIPLSLTQEGQYYIKCIKLILTIQKNMKRHFDDNNKSYTGSLVLGGSSYFCSFVFPSLINVFNKKFPKITVEIIESNAKELLEGLENESIDLIFETVITAENKSIKTYFYDSEYIILGVPANWTINEQLKKYQVSFQNIYQRNFLREEFLPVPLERFKDLPFIRIKRGNDQWNRGNSICKNAGFIPISVFQLDQVLTAFNIAAYTGAGAIFIRDSLMRTLNRNTADLVYYKIGDSLAKRDILIANKRKRYVTQAMNEFLKIACLKNENKIVTNRV